MKLQILSDLHLEFAPIEIPKTSADIIILAGDINIGTDALEFINKLIDEHEKPVCYVLGNHEFYNNDIANIIDFWEKVNDSHEHIYFLNDSSITIDDINIMGGTLWTNVDNKNHEYIRDLKYGMNDYTIISDNNVILHPTKTIGYHEHTVEKFIELVDSTMKNVVISHHAPSIKSIHKHFQHLHSMNSGFVSDLDNLFEHSHPFWDVNLWVHGHTHKSFDYKMHNTRVVCNPRGYHKMGENKKFKPAFIVEI